MFQVEMKGQEGTDEKKREEREAKIKERGEERREKKEEEKEEKKDEKRTEEEGGEEDPGKGENEKGTVELSPAQRTRMVWATRYLGEGTEEAKEGEEPLPPAYTRPPVRFTPDAQWSLEDFPSVGRGGRGRGRPLPGTMDLRLGPGPLMPTPSMGTVPKRTTRGRSRPKADGVLSRPGGQGGTKSAEQEILEFLGPYLVLSEVGSIEPPEPAPTEGASNLEREREEEEEEGRDEERTEGAEKKPGERALREEGGGQGPTGPPVDYVRAVSWAEEVDKEIPLQRPLLPPVMVVAPAQRGQRLPSHHAAVVPVDTRRRGRQEWDSDGEEVEGGALPTREPVPVPRLRLRYDDGYKLKARNPRRQLTAEDYEPLSLPRRRTPSPEPGRPTVPTEASRRHPDPPLRRPHAPPPNEAPRPSEKRGKRDEKKEDARQERSEEKREEKKEETGRGKPEEKKGGRREVGEASGRVEPTHVPGAKYKAVRLTGVTFKGLCPIPTDPVLDPPPRCCFNCWQEGHRRQQCPRPPVATYCANCGRRGVLVASCPRCRDAHRAWTVASCGRPEAVDADREASRPEAGGKDQLPTPTLQPSTSGPTQTKQPPPAPVNQPPTTTPAPSARPALSLGELLDRMKGCPPDYIAWAIRREFGGSTSPPPPPPKSQ